MTTASASQSLWSCWVLMNDRIGRRREDGLRKSTHLMNRLMHVHVVVRCHRLKVQMLLISLRLRASLRPGQVERRRRARMERLFVV